MGTVLRPGLWLWRRLRFWLLLLLPWLADACLLPPGTPPVQYWLQSSWNRSGERDTAPQSSNALALNRSTGRRATDKSQDRPRPQCTGVSAGLLENLRAQNAHTSGYLAKSSKKTHTLRESIRKSGIN